MDNYKGKAMGAAIQFSKNGRVHKRKDDGRGKGGRKGREERR